MRFFESEIDQRREDPYDEERFWPRFKCNRIVEIYDSSGIRWSCKIVDMSESGFGIVTDARLKRGAIVNIGDSEVQADVVWVRRNKAGLRICV